MLMPVGLLSEFTKMFISVMMQIMFAHGTDTIYCRHPSTTGKKSTCFPPANPKLHGRMTLNKDGGKRKLRPLSRAKFSVTFLRQFIFLGSVAYMSARSYKNL